jgi:hypothetical protein
VSDATGTILVIPGDQPLMSEAMLRGSSSTTPVRGRRLSSLRASTIPLATGA